MVSIDASWRLSDASRTSMVAWLPSFCSRKIEISSSSFAVVSAKAFYLANISAVNTTPRNHTPHMLIQLLTVVPWTNQPFASRDNVRWHLCIPSRLSSEPECDRLVFETFFQSLYAKCRSVESATIAKDIAIPGNACWLAATWTETCKTICL